MEIQALDNSEAGNGGGKACKFLLVYSRHHHHKPPSFMRIGNFDKIDSVVFLACGIPIPGGPVPRPNLLSVKRLEIALDAQGPWLPGEDSAGTRQQEARGFSVLNRRLGENSRVSNNVLISFFRQIIPE